MGLHVHKERPYNTSPTNAMTQAAKPREYEKPVELLLAKLKNSTMQSNPKTAEARPSRVANTRGILDLMPKEIAINIHVNKEHTSAIIAAPLAR